MKSLLLSLACAACALLLAAHVAEAQQQQAAVAEKPTFFKDVPGPPRGPRGLREQQPGEDDGQRIFHGGVASRTQFPYQAALFVDLSVFCGGSLIHEKWVLTAAHCVADGTTWYVMLGLTESLQPVQEGRRTHVTRGGYPHPDYNDKLIVNDVGLVQLMRPASLSTYIKTIALTPASASYVGKIATVSGFGRTDDTSASPISATLRYTKLPVVQNEVCSDEYGAETGGHPSVLCLRAEGSSSCKGDSGGPLTLTDSTGTQIQIGTVSFGSRYGCSLGKPVGYGNIAHLLGWISETTGQDFSS